MTPLDPKAREQLCAWMDGELPPDEARFLERRLANDGELRAQWERWQLVSTCIRNQPLLPMDRDFSERIQTVISTPDNAGAIARRKPIWGWAMAASIAALAVTIGVQMRPEKVASTPATVAHATAPFVAPVTASPASADLVALNPGPAGPSAVRAETTPTETAAPGITGKAAAGIRPLPSSHTTEVAALQSPMPLNTQSPTEFPLLQASEAKSWPRSPLSSSGDDASMEAYLVRHNEMVSDGGLGGFVPYVDVVTRERADGAAEGAGDPQAIEDNGQ